MIEFNIHKDSQSKVAPVVLTLPASRWDVLDARAHLAIDSLNEGFLEYEPPSDIPQLRGILKNMWRGESFFDELNFFAHCLSKMSLSDCILLNGALAIHRPDDMKTLINLIWHLDSIVMLEASSDTELGRFLVNNTFVEFPDSVIPYLDFTKIGAEHRANSSCAFDRNLCYEDLSPQIDEIYDGRTLPPILDNYVFRVSIAHGEHGSPTVELELPATQWALDAALQTIGAKTIDEADITGGNSRIALFSGLLQGEDLAQLDDLAHQIVAMDDERYIKLLAVLEKELAFSSNRTLESYPRLSEVHDCVHRLDANEFIPGIRPGCRCACYQQAAGSCAPSGLAHPSSLRRLPAASHPNPQAGLDIGSYGLVQWTPMQEMTMAQAEPEMGMGCF